MRNSTLKKPLIRFRVYTDTQEKRFGPFVYVNVWRTKKELWEYCPDIAELSPGFQAAFCGYQRRIFTKEGGEILAPDFGEINFHLDSLRMGIITHESAHAAIEWCRVHRIDPRDHGKHYNDFNTPEERFAWVLGNIARKVWLGAMNLVEEEILQKHHERKSRRGNTTHCKN